MLKRSNSACNASTVPSAGGFSWIDAPFYLILGHPFLVPQKAFAISESIEGEGILKIATALYEDAQCSFILLSTSSLNCTE
ncbi:hypothetical protein [Peribacillus loiseleuriae]|uniref:hypothetical protein n=1 Tax=Peribacillus loiseleuriae TaxID=1679170 RepID=UPI003D078A40